MFFENFLCSEAKRGPHPHPAPPTLLGGFVSEVLPVSLTIELEVAHRGGHGSGGFRLYRMLVVK